MPGCVGYRACCGTRGAVLCKSCDVETVRDAGGVLKTVGQEIGGAGRKRGYIYSSSFDLIHILCLVG